MLRGGAGDARGRARARRLAGADRAPLGAARAARRPRAPGARASGWSPRRSRRACCAPSASAARSRCRSTARRSTPGSASARCSAASRLDSLDAAAVCAAGAILTVVALVPARPRRRPTARSTARAEARDRGADRRRGRHEVRASAEASSRATDPSTLPGVIQIQYIEPGFRSSPARRAVALAATALPSGASAADRRATVSLTTVEVGAPSNPSVAVVPFTDAIYQIVRRRAADESGLPGRSAASAIATGSADWRSRSGSGWRS